MDVGRNPMSREPALPACRVSLDRHDDPVEQGVLDRWPGAVMGRPVVLRDGSEVLIRQIQRGDAALVADAFAGLSAESRQSRFLTSKTELSPAELRYFTEVDHHDHEALGALNPLDGRGLGIARFIRSAEDPEAAEIAVAIIDDWQGRGLGAEMLTQLTERAGQEGIRRFTALVAGENVAVLALLRNIGADLRLTDRESGALEYEIMLAQGGLSDGLQALLRAFARRRLMPPKPIRDVLAALVPARFPPEGE